MTAKELLARIEAEGLAVCRLTLTRPVEAGGRYLWFPMERTELERLMDDEQEDQQAVEQVD